MTKIYYCEECDWKGQFAPINPDPDMDHVTECRECGEPEPEIREYNDDKE